MGIGPNPHGINYYNKFNNGSKIENNINLIAEIVFDVIKGKYGNGEERKINLKNKEYDYKVIQKRINELLKNK